MAEASDQQGSIQGSSLWRIKCRKERSPSINWEVGKEGPPLLHQSQSHQLRVSIMLLLEGEEYFGHKWLVMVLARLSHYCSVSRNQNYLFIYD